MWWWHTWLHIPAQAEVGSSRLRPAQRLVTMGNTLTCFERWGKRPPDGPLLHIKAYSKEGKDGGIVQASSKASTATSTSAETPVSTGTAPAGGSLTPSGVERQSRRRQTYSSKTTKKSDTEVSSLDEDTDESDVENEIDGVSASDIRQKKFMEYRRALTKVVKLKTLLFSETVKVTCSRNGQQIEWYKGKSTAASPSDKKKPAGSFPVDKITSCKAQADNVKALVITVNVPQPTTYNFTFKSAAEREHWQEQVESLMKFIAMK
eukprot:XP_028354722.1 uncharacterized protein LOC114487645 isoform X2 [Physeter catodon]